MTSRFPLHSQKKLCLPQEGIPDSDDQQSEEEPEYDPDNPVQFP